MRQAGAVRRRFVLRVGQLERREDVRLEERSEWFSAHLLDDATEDQIAGVAVRVVRPRLEVERTRRVAHDDRVRRLIGRHLAIHVVERIVITISGQVPTEVEKRDVLRAR